MVLMRLNQKAGVDVDVDVDGEGSLYPEQSISQQVKLW